MKFHPPGTRQRFNFVILANGRECDEYEPPVPCFADDPNVVECVIPVEDAQKVTIKGSFKGSALRACFDVLADGSFVGSHRETGMQFKYSKRVQTDVGFKSFSHMPTPENVIEGDLTTNAFKGPLRSPGYMDGTGLGVGTIAIIASIHHKNDEIYSADYADCTLGNWRERDNIHNCANAGLQPKSELGFTHIKSVRDARELVRFQRRFCATRFGFEPFVTFVFYYRPLASIATAECTSRPKDWITPSPATMDSSVPASERFEENESGMNGEDRRQSLHIKKVRFELHHERNRQTNPALGSASRKRKVGDSINVDETFDENLDDAFDQNLNESGQLRDYDPDSLFLPEGPDSGDDSIHHCHDHEEHEEVGFTAETPAMKPLRQATRKSKRRYYDHEEHEEAGTVDEPPAAKPPRRRATKSKKSATPKLITLYPINYVREAQPKRRKTVATTTPARQVASPTQDFPDDIADAEPRRPRPSSLEIPVLDSPRTQVLRAMPPTLNELREAFPQDDGLTAQRLFSRFSNRTLSKNHLFELVDQVATKIGKKYYLKGNEELALANRSVWLSTRNNNGKANEDDDDASIVIVGESNVIQSTAAAAASLQQSVSPRHAALQENIASYMTRAEEIVGILHNRLDQAYEQQGIGPDEFDEWQASKARRAKLEAVDRAHFEAETKARLESTVQARVERELGLRLKLQRLPILNLKERLDHTTHQVALLERVLDAVRQQGQGIEMLSQPDGAAPPASDPEAEENVGEN